MLPDFVRVKAKRMRRFVRAVKLAQRSRSPITSRIRVQRQHEGDRQEYEQVDGNNVAVTYDQRLSSGFEIPLDEYPHWNRERYVLEAKRIGADLAVQAERNFMGFLGHSAARVNQPAETRGLTSADEIIINVLDGMDIDFDLHGNPIMPTLLTHPDTLKSIVPGLERAAQDEWVKRRVEELIERKRVEWRDREADRKLVG